MKKKGRYQAQRWHAEDRLTVAVFCVTTVLALLILILLPLVPLVDAGMNTPGEANEPETQTVLATFPTESVPETTEPSEDAIYPTQTEPTMLAELAPIFAENPDLAGWITIEGTVIDYPVMYTPNDSEKYIYKNLNGYFDVNGLPFIDAHCSIDPESDNLIVYGHNMRSGKMFASLLNYAQEEYREKHPTVVYSTLYETREYEIIAAFYDRVYYKNEDCFKFYQFIDAEDEAHFAEAITYFRENALYDTGITAEYGDKLLTLVTCSYHVANGRFVVVARQVTADP